MEGEAVEAVGETVEAEVVVLVVDSHQEVCPENECSENMLTVPLGVVGGRGSFQQTGPPDTVIGMQNELLSWMGTG